MNENRMGETKLREQQQLARAAEPKQSSGHLVWKIVGGAAVALVATGLMTSLHDIRRYIRMRKM